MTLDQMLPEDREVVTQAAAALGNDFPEYRHHGEQFVLEAFTPDEAKEAIEIGKIEAPRKVERREQFKRLLAKAYDRRQAESVKDADREKAVERAREPAADEVVVDSTPCNVSGDPPAAVEEPTVLEKEREQEA